MAPASGFQSLQFRLIENKLGINKVCSCSVVHVVPQTIVGLKFYMSFSVVLRYSVRLPLCAKTTTLIEMGN